MTTSTPQRRLLGLIDLYQRAVEGRPSPCRFTPSCSSYAKEAVESHGARRGTWLTVRRLVRCRPFGPSGFDPVPEIVTDDPITDVALTEVLPRSDVDSPRSSPPHEVY